jgi:hypothetical protein
MDLYEKQLLHQYITIPQTTREYFGWTETEEILLRILRTN